MSSLNLIEAGKFASPGVNLSLQNLGKKQFLSKYKQLLKDLN